jgi:hypothetical protein
VDTVGTILAVAASVLYSLIRLLLDVVATSRQEKVKLQAEVLVCGGRSRCWNGRSSGFNGARRIE